MSVAVTPKVRKLVRDSMRLSLKITLTSSSQSREYIAREFRRTMSVDVCQCQYSINNDAALEPSERD